MVTGTCHPPLPPKARGITLVELMVSLAVLAVIASLAAPSMKRLVQAQRLRTASYDMVGDLILARSEALKRGAQVRIVPSANGWAGGWIVQTVADSTLIGKRNPLGGGISVDPAPADITLDSNGRVVAASTVRFGLNSDSGAARCILLDPSGRPRSSTTSCP